jgi:benzoyl-CoA reductase/2-hydroxyglutaryl-CoA dehydratase subunit BcrC/BadD/HgdB
MTAWSELEAAAATTADTARIAAASGERARAGGAADSARFAAAGGVGVVACVGRDVPVELVLAAGLRPWVVPAADADELLRLLGAVDVEVVGLVLSHQAEWQGVAFARLRERAQELPPLAFLDLPASGTEPVRRYARARLEAFRAWLGALAGTELTDARVAEAIDRVNAQREALRHAGLTGVAGVTATLAARALEPERHVALLAGVEAPRVAGRRALVTGSALLSAAPVAELEDQGLHVVEVEGAFGAAWERLGVAVGVADPLGALLDAHLARADHGPARRAALVVQRARLAGADVVIHLRAPGDDGAAWDRAALGRALAEARIAGLSGTLAEVRALGTPGEARSVGLCGALERLPAPRRAARGASTPPESTRPPREGGRSRKALEATRSFGSYQREWFAEVRERAAAGEPFAVVNADAPQEVLRAFDIPFVVNQWWASIVGAKQGTRAYLDALAAHGYPDDVDAYSSMGLAAGLDPEGEPPWGGLPTPTLLECVTSQGAGKVYESWSRASGAPLLTFARTIESRVGDLPTGWWDDLPHRWDEVIEPERLDLMEAELRASITKVEDLTGRTFDPVRFAEVMDLVNEQEEHYRATRDLIAQTRPAPVGIADTMPATMVPQWHRGTTWGRDAARAFHDEVRARAEAGAAACPGERLRLMWVGRGLWRDMGFYQRFEQSHGAVFVWSMYLALAADGYLRYTAQGQDPLRALAARFVTMGDELRMPAWAAPWHVHEARTHGIDAAVAIADADPHVVAALRAAGVPVLQLGIDNTAGDADLDGAVRAFLDGLVLHQPA